MIYYISDTHFYHENIIKYCNRPFNSVDEMNSELIKRWNLVVKPEDEVYHLGDFALCRGELIPLLVSSLNGIKHFVYGNHDSLGPHGKSDWVSINKELYIKDGSRTVWLNHFPYQPSGEAYNPKHVRPKATQNWDIALNGHVHEKWLINKYNSINVGVDLLNFTPQTLNQLIEKSGWSGKIKI